MGHVHPTDHGTALDSACSGYAWATHQANLRDVHELQLLPVDSGWNVEDARQRPEPLDFPDVLNELQRLKTAAVAEGLSPERTLPERIATVAMWNLARADLDHANRCGAAWSVIPTGMAAHEWTFRNDEARVVIYFAQLYFFDRHDSVAKLSELLHTCFVPPNRHHLLQRLRFRALLDRREHERVLNRELEYRRRNPAGAAHVKGQRRGGPTRTSAARKKRRQKRRK